MWYFSSQTWIVLQGLPPDNLGGQGLWSATRRNFPQADLHRGKAWPYPSWGAGLASLSGAPVWYSLHADLLHGTGPQTLGCSWTSERSRLWGCSAASDWTCTAGSSCHQSQQHRILGTKREKEKNQCRFSQRPVLFPSLVVVHFTGMFQHLERPVVWRGRISTRPNLIRLRGIIHERATTTHWVKMNWSSV